MAWREESGPHLKPINRIPKLIRTATAVIVAGGLAIMVISAQDDLDTVRQAADQGDAKAQYNLGVMYTNGRRVLKDAAEAVKWYRQAADQGLASAQFSLGVMYSNGRGVLKDSVLAHMWSNIAGANGHEAARELRDNLKRDMTRAEVSRATELARDCMSSDYQDCAL